MVDHFKILATGLTAPAAGAFPITPDDAQDLSQVSRALYVGVSGDVVVVMKSGDEITFVNAQAGSVLAVRAMRVKASGTTAQDLVGLV